MACDLNLKQRMGSCSPSKLHLCVCVCVCMCVCAQISTYEWTEAAGGDHGSAVKRSAIDLEVAGSALVHSHFPTLHLSYNV